jgi:hypothetical protein
MAVLVVFLIGTLMLAKLFDSDTLGWVFGLSLMFAFALVPCAAVFYAGMALASRWMRVRAAASSAVAAPPAHQLSVSIDRDSVHAGDDVESHALTLIADADETLAGFIARLRARRYFPGISGGEATWIVESSGHGSRPIGVLAQQWPEPKWLVQRELALKSHFEGTTPAIRFKYWCQADPEAVFSALESGRELPSRHRT